MSQNKEKNKYQILTILSAVIMLAYGYAWYNAYHSFAANRSSRLTIYGIVFFCGVVMFVCNIILYRKVSKQIDKPGDTE